MNGRSSNGVPTVRIRNLNGGAVRMEGSFVLYWMIAARRTRWNFALDRAVALARELDRPLVVLEPLRAGYEWASDRLHRFVIEGMADNEQRFANAGVAYHAYVEPKAGAGRGLLEQLARDACAVVTDDFPAFFLPRMLAAAADKLKVRLEAVDSNGIFPMHATERVFSRAYDFRRFLQRELPHHLDDAPRADALRTKLRPLDQLPSEVLQRWPRASEELLSGCSQALAQLPIDHSVAPAATRGGESTGRKALGEFLAQRLSRYGVDRNQPDSDGSSGISPYLHFGHVSAHEALQLIATREKWSPDHVSTEASGKREGWWRMSEPAEAFLDQLVTWREIGFNLCAHREDYDRYESLPGWARTTLKEHEDDPRPHVYTPEQFELAETHDDLWNAAQNQLRGEGRIHNYLRMLWGKKILHWSESPREALEILIHLNNKYALDGRNPNSYSGIFWILGRNDRAWGPEREVFGKIRYMTCDSTRRKLRVKDYVKRWNSSSPEFNFG